MFSHVLDRTRVGNSLRFTDQILATSCLVAKGTSGFFCIIVCTSEIPQNSQMTFSGKKERAEEVES